METRKLGTTDLSLPLLSFGASSLGAEFRAVDITEAMRAVHTALDLGMNYIDTSPYYGRGMSEVLLGVTLGDVPRDSYILSTKLGRYDAHHFDFSAKRVEESIDVSLHRLRTDHIDMVFCHDIEYVDMSQIVEETLPALRKQQEKGKVRYIGVSGYPMKIFNYVMDHCPIDVILSYNHYTMQNQQLLEIVPRLREQGVGIINASPFAARLLTNAPLPDWHKATPQMRECARAAAAHCDAKGVDIAKLAVQYSVRHPDLSTCMIGSANPKNVLKWARWLDEPFDEKLAAEVMEILKPVHNHGHVEGLPENN